MKILFVAFTLLQTSYSIAQASIDSIVEVKQAKELLERLAGKDMQGRGNYSIHLHNAAGFIESQFKESGLQYFPGFESYKQYFTTKELTWSKVEDTISNLLVNVIGLIEGKSRPGEVVIFSAHYDHLGQEGNQLFYGANDNASGTTAMLMLMRYYAARKDNERTLVFCAFSGEELGLHGSEYFSHLIAVDSVVAMINLEMMGRTNISGNNSFMVTGDNYSDLYNILRKNLEGRKIKLRRDIRSSKELFSRSDNYPFAKKGVPAHTIMCSDDDDPCYHRPCDNVSSLNIPNMVNIIKAIAQGCSTLVSGEDTPKRINPKRIFW